MDSEVEHLMRFSGGRRGRIEGHVTAQVGDHVGATIVAVTDGQRSLVPAHTFVDANGYYEIDDIPNGTWKAFCNPELGRPIASATYQGILGYDAARAKPINITHGITEVADFVLEPAGQLAVSVTNVRGEPVSHAYLTSYAVDSEVFCSGGRQSNSQGQATLGNVPLASKLYVTRYLARRDYTGGTWWPNASSHADAAVITIDDVGGATSVTIVLSAVGCETA